ncbi:uncharacterized protein LOC124138368 [Haliotis rufescens]|uniref:uncharacterized protein LOC124138368 n=1 Tax=Haliotis rufescens TaxID=6454 RepID=UPI00201F922F|nr:uncharacterized protein LOC124138368 [Haliotis rufescens]
MRRNFRQADQFENRQYGDTQYDDSQYGGHQYGDTQYDDSQYGGHQYGDTQYDDTQYGGHQYGDTQYDDSQYEGRQYQDGPSSNRQATFVELLRKQSDVIDKLTDRVSNVGMGQSGGYDYEYEEAYEEPYNYEYEGYEDPYYSEGIGPGPVRVRGRGMGQHGLARGPRPMMDHRGGPRGGPRRGPGRGPRGAHRGSRGMGPYGNGMGGRPMGPRGDDHPYKRDSHGGRADPKQCKLYLEAMKKNMPTNPDTLSLYCPGCSYLARNNMDFLNHHKSHTHSNQMARVEEMPPYITKQVHEAIAKIFQQRKDQKSLMYCSICDLDLHIPYSDHKNLELHKIRCNTIKLGCIICKTKPFNSFPEYKAHCKINTHIEKAEVERMKSDELIERCTQLKDFPPHKDGVAYAQSSVVHVEGMYCTLCKRFFENQEEADAHTTHKSHYNHVRDLFFNKNNTEEVDMGEYPEPKTSSMIASGLKLEDM